MLTHTLSLFIHMHHRSYVITNHTHAHSYAIAIHSQVYWSWLRKNHWTLISFGSIPTELNSLTVIVFESHWFISVIRSIVEQHLIWSTIIHTLSLFIHWSTSHKSFIRYRYSFTCVTPIRSFIRYRYSFTHILEPIVKHHSWIATQLFLFKLLAIHSFYLLRGNKLKLVAYDCTQVQGWSMNR